MRPGVALLQLVEDKGAAVAAAGGADLPEILARHGLEVGAGYAELRLVEDGLAAAQLVEMPASSGSVSRAGSIGELMAR